MFEYYKQHARHYVGVDCIIFGVINGELSILLTRRNFEPGKGEWSLMGGFVGDNESLDDAVRRVLFELTGMDDIYMQQVGTFGALNRDPGARVISVAYYALINTHQFSPRLDDNIEGQWVSLKQLPILAFDHLQMIEKARELMRKTVTHEPVGFNLLPELFTLSQLQSLYESILGENIDKRNFRKRIAENECIEKTDHIDKTGSRRGAQLYTFNEQKYLEDHKFRL